MIRYRLIFNPNDHVAPDGTAPIVLEIAFNRTRKKHVNTGIRCTPKEWDQERRRVKHMNPLYKKMNLRLDGIKRDIQEFQLDLENQGREFTREALNSFLNKEGEYATFNKFYQSKLDRDINLRESTKKDQQRTLDRLNEFNSAISWSSLDKRLIDNFEKYLVDERGISTNTLSKHQKNIRKYLKKAMQEKLLREDPYMNVTIHRVKGERGPLTPEQLKRLEALDYRDKPYVQRVLDLFLFGCYTGMRISDIMALKAGQIEGDKIRYTSIKTGVKVILPLKNKDEVPDGVKALKILKGYNSKGKVFPDVSSAETSRHIKRIAADAEIDGGIVFHESRHTFCTQVARKNKDPYAVMRRAGITKMDVAMGYVKIAQEEE